MKNLTTPGLTISILAAIIYSVGIAGILIPFSRSLFIGLIPLILILSLAVSLYFQQVYNRKTILIFFLIAVFSWAIEAAGVATGDIFGSYYYGEGLGPQLFETPLIIGLNWLLLVYSSAALAGKITIHPVTSIILASFLMVLNDLALEAAAPHLDMWRFADGTAPLQNYIVWFVMAVLFHTILKITHINISNKVAAIVFMVQFVFMLILAIVFNL